ncbi:MAG: DUF2461 domain-containing protein [Bacteroidetes bacterium]|nr:DUF2461 domain-containing protein [Bacteroidota bacterium]
MISKNIFSFLKALSENNNREWFEKHKPEYQIIQAQFKEFLEELVIEMSKFDDTLQDVDVSKAIFRIYRDVRFSKDKTPYKTNMGAWINKGGKNSINAGYYLQIQPGGNSFAAAGSYFPDASNLKKLRQEIDYNSIAFKKILNAKRFKETFGDLSDFKLKTNPKGYDPTNPMIEYLKQKSFIVTKQLKDSEISKPDFIRSLSDIYKTAQPLVQFLNNALD